MGYLKDAEHDVFVSYARIDNETVGEQTEGWVDLFQRYLEVELGRALGARGERGLDIWRDDDDLSGAAALNETVEGAVRGSAVMLSLLSRGYVDPECYCMKEIDWFEDEAASPRSPALVVDGNYRVIPILLQNIPHDDRPEFLQNRCGFEFYSTKVDKRGFPLEPGSQEFMDVLRSLVSNLCDILESLRRADTTETGGDTAAASFRVFLSSPPDDLGPTARRLKTSLEKNEIEVVTGLPPPHPRAEHDAKLREILADTDLAVHLLSHSPGEPVDDFPERTYPVEQIEIGRDHDSTQLVLYPSEFEIEMAADEAYANYLRALESSPREAGQLEIVRTSQMLDAILRKREAVEEARRRAAPNPIAEGHAFIDLHNNDVANSLDLVKYLSERNLAPMMVPSADQGPTLATFNENLRKVSVFIAVFGSSPVERVLTRLFDAYKQIVLDKLEIPIGVYVAPPPDQDKDTQPIASLPFVSAVNLESFDPAKVVEPLLEKVAASA